MWRRVPFLFLSALASAALFVVVVIGWVRTEPPAKYLGWSRVRESTPNLVVTDSYDAQMLRGSLWVGRTRFMAFAPLGFRVEQTEVEEAMSNPDVFWILGHLSPQPYLFLGFGRVSGVAMDGPLLFYVSGALVPCWFLALLTGVLPGIWIGRQVRKARGPHQPATQMAQGAPDQPLHLPGGA